MLLIVQNTSEYNHFASNSQKRTRGFLPHDVQWNSGVDCFELHTENRPILMITCEENSDRIDGMITAKVVNMGLKRNVEDLLIIPKPISLALDTLQKDCSCTTAAVEIWKEHEKPLKKEILNDKVKLQAIKKWMDQVLIPPNFPANILKPK